MGLGNDTESSSSGGTNAGSESGGHEGEKNTVSGLSFGVKAAVIVGLGADVSFLWDGKNLDLTITGSYGLGVQTPTGNFSTFSELLEHSVSRGSPTLSSQEMTSSRISTTTSHTADIGLGVVGTYDLDNLNESGIPNSLSVGSFGGAVWYNSTTTINVFSLGSKQ